MQRHGLLFPLIDVLCVGPENDVKCDKNKILYPTIEIYFRHLSKRFRPGTRNFSNGIA